MATTEGASAAATPRVAFDATHLSRLGAGVSTFILGLLEGLADLQRPEWSLVVVAKARQVDELRDRLPSLEIVPVKLWSNPQRIVWEQIGLPQLLGHLGAALVHSPHYSLPLLADARRVVTIHDLSYVLTPEQHRRSHRWFFRQMIPRAARAADHIFCDSECTRRDLRRLYSDLNPAKISVVPLAVDPTLLRPVSAARLDEVRRAYGLPARFVLHVGTVEPRKNIGTAVAAVSRLAGRDPGIELVLVGQRGWESEDLFSIIDQSPAVRRLGHVAANDLSAIYRLASALVMPSHYEGFGLPVLEAMAIGLPVVSSGKGSLAEVGGDATLTPIDDTVEAYEAALREALANGERRDEARRRGFAQASRFSWARAASATAAVYERLLPLPRSPE